MTRYPEVYNSYQYAMLSNEAANNIGLADVYNEEKMEKFRTGDGEFYKSTNWLHAITRDNAPETSHNFSVKGGNEYARYYLSAGVMDQQSYLDLMTGIIVDIVCMRISEQLWLKD